MAVYRSRRIVPPIRCLCLKFDRMYSCPNVVKEGADSSGGATWATRRGNTTLTKTSNCSIDAIGERSVGNTAIIPRIAEIGVARRGRSPDQPVFRIPAAMPLMVSSAPRKSSPLL